MRTRSIGRLTRRSLLVGLDDRLSLVATVSLGLRHRHLLSQAATDKCSAMPPGDALSNVQGGVLGTNVANWVLANYFEPKN